MKKDTRDAVRDGAIRSAAVILPLVFDHPVLAGMPETVWGAWPTGILDVGAGEGHWMREVRNLRPASSVLGVDVEPRDHALGWPFVNAWDAENGDRLPMRSGPGAMQTHDDWEGEHKWPLALCMEMAEHVDADAGAWLVSELCRVADFVVFSAAAPGQGGDGHKNEQWPEYWAALFAEQGYTLADPFRLKIWTDERIDPWYRQNLLIACTAKREWPAPLSLVHPAIYEWKLESIDYWRDAWNEAAADAERWRNRAAQQGWTEAEEA